MPHNSGANFTDIALILLIIGGPIIIAAPKLFISDDAPFKLASESKNLFKEKCKYAGEEFIYTPDAVKSVYLDSDWSQSFNKIIDGTYSGSGGGILGDPLVNSGYLLFFERKNKYKRSDNNEAKYTKHALNDWQGVPVNKLSSEYGVFQDRLFSKHESERLGLYGNEVSVKNLKTGKIAAKLTYYYSKSHRTICGHSDVKYFTVSEFIRRALNLSRQFPDAYSKKSS